MAEPDEDPLELGRTEEADVDEAEEEGDEEEEDVDVPPEADLIPKPSKGSVLPHFSCKLAHLSCLCRSRRQCRRSSGKHHP